MLTLLSHLKKLNQSSQLTRIYRLFRLLLHTLAGLAIATFAWPFMRKKTKLWLTKWWSYALLKCFNIQLVTSGILPNKAISGTMFVANHISWMDIHAINSVIPLRFIAKSEISAWPVFGYLVKQSGALFIDRKDRKDALRIVETATQNLCEGENVGFFPEGTTSEGASLLPFKSSIMQAAIDAKAHIWPIGIRYPLESGEANTQMAYAGETSLGESIWNVLKQKNPVVELHFLTPLPALETNRHALSRAAHMAISKQLNL